MKLPTPPTHLYFPILKNGQGTFPGGPLVRNLPNNAEDTGSTPGLETRISHATGQLSSVRRLWKPACPGAYALQQEKPPQGEACAPQPERRPSRLQLEKASHFSPHPKFHHIYPLSQRITPSCKATIDCWE